MSRHRVPEVAARLGQAGSRDRALGAVLAFHAPPGAVPAPPSTPTTKAMGPQAVSGPGVDTSGRAALLLLAGGGLGHPQAGWLSPGSPCWIWDIFVQSQAGQAVVAESHQRLRAPGLQSAPTSQGSWRCRRRAAPAVGSLCVLPESLGFGGDFCGIYFNTRGAINDKASGAQIRQVPAC